MNGMNIKKYYGGSEREHKLNSKLMNNAMTC